jgi:hypothetical protein
MAELCSESIVRFEKGEEVRPGTISAIRRALEAAGVIFVEANGQGPGARLRKPE